MLIDSHCHLDMLTPVKECGSVAAVVAEAEAAGVGHLLCIGVTLEAFPAMKALCAPYPQISLSVGVHPLHDEGAWDQPTAFELARDPQVVAIGETGLDYFYAPATRERQQHYFAEHVRLARQVGKPLIIHTRDARADTLAILRDERAEEVGGVLHCFTEDWATAKAAMDLGFYISISGIVTFRNADALRDVVRQIPLDRLLVETDSPYLAPVPHRGRENTPAYVRDVAAFVASLHGVSPQMLAERTSANFRTLFKAGG